MKLNWGLGIAIFYGSFMAILLFFVIRSASYDHSLVMDNYYEQDLNYEQHYQKIVNANSLGQTMGIKYDETTQNLEIFFPEHTNTLSGTLVLFRPADHREDFKQNILLEESTSIIVPTDKLARGHWKIQVDWSLDGVDYYRETELYL